MTDPSQRALLFKKMHLFVGIVEGELREIAELFEEQVCDTRTILFPQNAQPDYFYVIFKGSVQIITVQNKKEDVLATLTAGDYFGETGLMTGKRRVAAARAEPGTILLKLNRDNFKHLLKEYKELRANFEIIINSRALTRQKRFKWLDKDEVVYILARKDRFLLYVALLKPAAALVIPAVLFGVQYFYTSTFLTYLALALILVVGLWMVWNYLDWSNDYYVVTNRRIVWLENVLSFSPYESRKQLVLSYMASVNTETDQWGRIFDSGTVIVKTFADKISLNVDHPYQVQDMIKEYWGRAKEGVVLTEQQKMQEFIRKKITPSGSTPQTVKPPQKRAPTFSNMFFPNFMKMRVEEGGAIIYRKHWYILVRDTWPALSLSLLDVSLLIIWFIYGREVISTSVVVTLLVFLLGFFGWWVYGYMDWSNDVYQVTADQIIDLDRKPFGNERRRSAQIESIMNLDSNREGILGMLLNFGTVYIAVAGDKFDFEGVYDPVSVHEDINRRLYERVRLKREKEANQDRDKITDWIVAYHKLADEMKKAEDQKKGDSSP